MLDCVIGIDPGASGGIAVLSLKGRLLYLTGAGNLTPQDIVKVIEDQARVHKCYLERVASRPGQGVASMFKFGQNFGTYIGILTALRIPFELVSPQVWQKALGCMTKGDKNVTKQKAQELYPTAKITHAVADALLIAEYGRRVIK